MKNKGIEVMREYLDMMEYKVISIDNDIVVTYDLEEGVQEEYDIEYWCHNIIEILQRQLRDKQDMGKKAIKQCEADIKILKSLC